jgi:hypothetical protein
MSGGSFPAPSIPKIFSVLDPHHGGIFVIILVPTDFHGACRDSRISNINKKFIFFSQNYDSSMTLFFPFFILKNKYFHVLLKKTKTTHNAFIIKKNAKAFDY